VGSSGASPKQKASQGKLKGKESSEPTTFNSNIVVKNMNISEMLNKYKLKSKILQQRGADAKSNEHIKDKDARAPSNPLAPVVTNENNETSRYSFVQSAQEDSKMTQLYGGNDQNRDRSKQSSTENSHAGRSQS